MSAKPKTLCQQKIENPDISLARFGRDISLCRWRHKKKGMPPGSGGDARKRKQNVFSEIA